MKNLYCICIFLILAITACKTPGNKKDPESDRGNEYTSVPLDYAAKFRIEQNGPQTKLTVLTPWQNASDTRFEYTLVPDSLAQENFYDSARIITTPVRSAVIMSTTFIPFFDTLGSISSIKGASSTKFIYNSDLQKRVEAGRVKDIGFDGSINYELLVELDPQVVFLFGVQSGIVQLMNKLQEIGIKAVICADYLEPHPLGRAEWLKFFAPFFQQQQLADSIFAGIAEKYVHLSDSASRFKVQPSVMLGLPWKDTWYVAGGNSFAARFIDDAGGKYIFADENHAEAKPYDIESVFAKALQAEIWLNPGIAASREAILEHDSRFNKLRSMQNRQIYNNNKRIGPGGGNDYWESGILYPDLILKDLIRIFHDPEVDNGSLHYYSKID